MNYSDDEFIAAMEACTIESFHHPDHVRLARLYCERLGHPEASRKIVETLRRFASHAGEPTKYHHTMTLAWMRLVNAANPELLAKDALLHYYSPEALASETARTGWIEPDRAPLP